MPHVSDPSVASEIQTICCLMEKLLEREDGLRQEVEELKFQMEHQFSHKQTCDHCADLRTVITRLENKILHQEFTVSSLLECQWLLDRDLTLERQKVWGLESRLADQYLVNESLLRAVTQVESNRSSWDIQHVLLENERQRESISTLLSTLDVKDITIQCLQMALQDISPDSCGTNDGNTLQSELECPSPRDDFLTNESRHGSSTPRPYQYDRVSHRE
ncbi:hypothetical protein BDV32DRAFT_143705 [Aspergillus pseudonomiae]|uniref:Uncharacterized protein n=1 Tax=Aspergillus pseudotamarii TaxID=132259 RepID=A0A5N6SJK2_ASPPS|nr:uncharacterized protein BDV38DRAFT_286478 [Aspergillus pseudotamarii]KAB8265967.1 hypothetical protein BDV32DRAFT_143705 [Aspergillus pseudonomiae]KAE8133861.1 hypothetical protein BDV38DRAFT_286478 [Aspergillus pseudotamarii]